MGSRRTDGVDWSGARELGAAGRYREVRAALGELRAEAGDQSDPRESALLAAARQLCEIGLQHRAEAELHTQACQAATSRERDLRSRLDAILRLLAGDELASANGRRLGSLTPSGSVNGRAESSWPTTHRPVPTVDRGQQEADLVVFCLGPVRIYHGDELIDDWHGVKSQSVLRYLLTHRRKHIPKDVLMELFWPDGEREASRRNLHQAVYSLRRTLRRRARGSEHICFGGDCYFVNPELAIWLDFEEFEHRAQRGERLEQHGQVAEALDELAAAESLYRGDLFEDRPYDEWAIPLRERLRSIHRRAVLRLSDHHLRRGEYTPVIALCQKLLAADPCDEESHRRLMVCYVAQGQRHLAAQQYRVCCDALRAEIGVAPSEETEGLRRAALDSRVAQPARR